ncbi:hypothetical protein R6Q59_027442 [Mikania micrantha]
MPDSMLQNQQGKYIRARENPFFDGLIRRNSSRINRNSPFDFMGKPKMAHSSSVIGHKEYKSDTVSHSSSKVSHVKEPVGLSLSESVDLSSPQRPDNIQSFNMRKQVSLPPCAASFYYGNSPQIDAVESCQSIQKLNMYLKAGRDAVNAGVPGRFFRAVLGPVSDAGSFISVIMYSFYLNETDKTSQFCTVPVINLKREDINSHGELEWLLRSCGIDLRSLLFIDEVDLSYYDLFGSLKIVLLNADKLQDKQEALKDSIVEVFNCQKLSGILLDTENLTSPKCASVDRYMSTLLLNGAGRFGCNGLYHILRSKMHNVSHLTVGQILHQDFKKQTATGKTDISGCRMVVGMSAVGISISQLLSHNKTSMQEIVVFQQLEKLRLLVVISGCNHLQNFKEMLISAESGDLMKDLLCFLDTHASYQQLQALYQPVVGVEMRAFTVDSDLSRKTIEQLLQDFCTA